MIVGFKTQWPKNLFAQELLEDGLLDQFHKNLVKLNMDSAQELQSYINKLQLAVEQSRQKLLQSDGVEGKTEVGVYFTKSEKLEMSNSWIVVLEVKHFECLNKFNITFLFIFLMHEKTDHAFVTVLSRPGHG